MRGGAINNYAGATGINHTVPDELDSTVTVTQKTSNAGYGT